MQVLDGKSRNPRWQMERIEELLKGATFWGILDACRETYSARAIQEASGEFLKCFRSLVDQWIDSGIDSNGVEQPLTRSVSRVPPRYSEPLINILAAWLGRNMPVPALMNTGRIAIICDSPKPFGLDPAFYANECAVYWLKELLDYPRAHRLARCANSECQTYYVRERLRKTEIKRGAYCRNCSAKGSARRTKASREARKRELIYLAATLWPDWRPTRRGTQSEWIAGQINKKLSTARITGKWVSQNRESIKAEL